MKYLALIILCGFGISLAMPKSRKEKSEKVALAPSKAMHKVLAQHITQKGRLLIFVDSYNTQIGRPSIEDSDPRLCVDWKKLSKSITRPGRIAELGDPEITFTGNKPRQIE